MSFSYQTKLEIIENFQSLSSCLIVETACILKNCGVFYSKSYNDFLIISTEDFFIINTIFTLLKKSFSISIELILRKSIKQSKTTYLLVVKSQEHLAKLRALYELELETIDDGCARQFLTLMYLMNGTLTDPQKSYHLEFIFTDEELAGITASLLNRMGFKANTIVRKNYHVTYLKDGSHISDFLSLMNAHGAVMEFANIRILKEIKGNVNRQVNLETANLKKTISARVKHQEDIDFIFTKYGRNFLSPELMTVAMGRIDYPDQSLNELGEILGLTKSCINHRLRRISKIANNLRGEL